MTRESGNTVVVIGAGLAGLTAAATAARAGQPVTVVEAHAGGGRARTDERNGFRLNQGPHALYRGGEAWRILRDLGVRHHGHMPPFRGARASRDGQLVRLAGASTGALAAKILKVSPAGWAGRRASDWADSLGRGDVSDLARMFTRVSTYVADLDRLPAELAISQLKQALFHGVSYIDGGWATLVDGLAAAAAGAGAAIRTHERAVGLTEVPGGWEVALADGGVLPASGVVIAAGGPLTARKLLPVDPGWPDLGPPVTAACLDLGLRGKRPSILFGLDEPLYLAPHCPPGDLAPKGASLVHVMRYGARGAEPDRAELQAFARLAGITDDKIVEDRFLADMVVTHVLPAPGQGLAGRPGVTATGCEGVYLAGDWVGPTGWLTDAVMASGREAGRLAAGPRESQRTYTSVA